MSIKNIKDMFSKRICEAEQVVVPKEEELKEGDGEAKSLGEVDVGINAYLSQHDGFSGVIKHRYSDFHVHEIDTDGVVVRVASSAIPPNPKYRWEASTPLVLDKSVWEELDALNAAEREIVKIDVTAFDKSHRERIHKAIKAKFDYKLITNTTEEDGKKHIVITKYLKGKKDFRWPSSRGKYLYFGLFKSNMDTLDALSVLSSQLRVKQNNFTYAGTKDKRANTSQMVCIKQLPAERLQSIAKGLRQIMVGNYSYRDTPLQLGDLKGNHFDIVLRDVTAPDEQIKTSLNAVEKNGFLNYYGTQRFGNSASVPTYEIGRALVKGDFKLAVELILKPRNDNCSLDMKQARERWWETRNATSALKGLRNKNALEGKVLMGLAKNGANAYVNALDYLPRNTRLLYIHSYQSLLWNKVLTKRMQTYGLTLLEGDLVANPGYEVEKPDEADEHIPGKKKFNKELGIMMDMTEIIKDNELEEKWENKKQEPEVRHLSQEELKKFTIYDIIHPLPGHAIIYPNNIVGQWYEELLAEDELTSEGLKLHVKKYALSGTYRKIVKKVNKFRWRIVRYSDPDQDILLSDLDKFKGKSLKEDEGPKDLKGVVLSFALEPSTYATMLLREILRVDTSASFQAKLTTDHKRKRGEKKEPGTNKKMKMNLNVNSCGKY